MNIGKSFLFRILNRFVKNKTQINVVDNLPVKRNYEDFMVYRYIGGRFIEGSLQPPANLITNKTDNYYFPLTQL